MHDQREVTNVMKIHAFRDDMDRVEGARLYNFAVRLFNDLNRPQALFALMVSAMHVDGTVAEAEQIEVDALLGRSRSLRKLKPAQVKLVQRKIQNRLTGDRLYRLISQACHVLKKDRHWAHSAFAHAVDIIFADSRVLPSEQDFLTTIGHQLEIDFDIATRTLEMLKIKNEHVDGLSDPSKSNLLQPANDDVALADAQRRAVMEAVSGQQRVGLTAPEAMFVILWASSLSDGERQPEERIEIDALASRTRTLGALDANEREAIHTRLTPKMRTEKSLNDLLIEACRSIPKNLRLSAYGHALDIVYADTKIRREEDVFMARLARELSLTTEQMRDMAEVMALKNKR